MSAGTKIKTATGRILPLVASPELISKIDGKSGRAIRLDCEAGRIPTLPRTGELSHWRIPVARYLDFVGLPYVFVEGVIDAQVPA